MKKAAVVAGACAALALVFSLAVAHPYAAARPGGVSANAWIPLTADAGFVVTGNDSQASKVAPTSSVTGYLMARRDGKWVRLDPEAVAHLIPMN
jgi:hypothetical protein